MFVLLRIKMWQSECFTRSSKVVSSRKHLTRNNWHAISVCSYQRFWIDCLSVNWALLWRYCATQVLILLYAFQLKSATRGASTSFYVHIFFLWRTNRATFCASSKQHKPVHTLHILQGNVPECNRFAWNACCENRCCRHMSFRSLTKYKIDYAIDLSQQQVRSVYSARSPSKTLDAPLYSVIVESKNLLANVVCFRCLPSLRRH